MSNKYINYNDIKLTAAQKEYLGQGSVEDRVVFEAAILEAEGIVDAHMGVTYILPLSDAQETQAVKSAAKRIAIWYLHVDHAGALMPDKIQLGYDTAMEYLTKLAANKANLGLDDGDEDEIMQPITSRFIK